MPQPGDLNLWERMAKSIYVEATLDRDKPISEPAGRLIRVR